MTDAAYVRVRVASEHYALPVQAVLHVGPLEEVMPVPGAPPQVLGVCNFRGEVLAAVDLSVLAGVERAEQPRMVAIVEDAGRRAGVAVDGIIDVGPLPPPSGSPPSSLLSGTTLVDGTLVGIVDPEELLAAGAWSAPA